MDDLKHCCPSCHELCTPEGAPTHVCGRTPQGTLPNAQPHKAPEVASSPRPAPMRSFSQIVAGIFGIKLDPSTYGDYTLAGPEDS